MKWDGSAQPVEHRHIEEALKSEGLKYDWMHISDRKYYLPTTRWTQEIGRDGLATEAVIHRRGHRALSYLAESNDCDDRARFTQTLMQDIFFKQYPQYRDAPLAVGQVRIMRWRGRDMAHRACFFIEHGTLKVRYFDIEVIPYGPFSEIRFRPFGRLSDEHYELRDL